MEVNSALFYYNKQFNCPSIVQFSRRFNEFKSVRSNVPMLYSLWYDCYVMG